MVSAIITSYVVLMVHGVLDTMVPHWAIGTYVS